VITLRLSKRDWILAPAVGVGVWLFGIVVKFPQGILSTDHFPRLEDHLKLCADPFARDVQFDPRISYNRTYPCMAPSTFAYSLYSPADVLPDRRLRSNFFLVVSERTGDRRFSLLVVAGLSLTFFALWTSRWLGSPDAFSHFCSAVGLLSSSPVRLALICILGTLNDERWIFSAPFLLYWHGSNHAQAGTINLIEATRAGSGLAIGILLALLVRHALTVGWLGPGIVEPEP
jgi:hypothetical protein